MKKQLLVFAALCALLTSCENYTTTSNPPNAQNRGTTTTTTSTTRDQNQPGNPNNPNNPDMMNRNMRDQGR
jgi:hypothetical protein